MRRALFLPLLLCAEMLCASQPNVNVVSEQRADNSLSFIASIDGHGSVTVELLLSDMENVKDGQQPRIVKTFDNRGGEIARIYPADSTRRAAADFDFNWLQGVLDAKPEKDFVYRLPYEAGITTAPKRLDNYDVMLFRGNFRDFTAWQFPLRRGDKIYPIRKGIVMRTEGFYHTDDEEEVMMSSLSNYIYIEHPDGVISTYNMLEPNSLMVREGDTVYPDTPLARAGAADRESFGIRLSLYYYATNRSAMYPGMMAQTIYLDPLFMTTDGNVKLADGETVTSDIDKQLIKRDKKSSNFWRRLFSQK